MVFIFTFSQALSRSNAAFRSPAMFIFVACVALIVFSLFSIFLVGCRKVRSKNEKLAKDEPKNELTKKVESILINSTTIEKPAVVELENSGTSVSTNSFVFHVIEEDIVTHSDQPRSTETVFSDYSGESSEDLDFPQTSYSKPSIVSTSFSCCKDNDYDDDFDHSIMPMNMSSETYSSCVMPSQVPCHHRYHHPNKQQQLQHRAIHAAGVSPRIERHYCHMHAMQAHGDFLHIKPLMSTSGIASNELCKRDGVTSPHLKIMSSLPATAVSVSEQERRPSLMLRGTMDAATSPLSLFHDDDLQQEQSLQRNNLKEHRPITQHDRTCMSNPTSSVLPSTRKDVSERLAAFQFCLPVVIQTDEEEEPKELPQININVEVEGVENDWDDSVVRFNEMRIARSLSHNTKPTLKPILNHIFIPDLRKTQL